MKKQKLDLRRVSGETCTGGGWIKSPVALIYGSHVGISLWRRLTTTQAAGARGLGGPAKQRGPSEGSDAMAGNFYGHWRTWSMAAVGAAATVVLVASQSLFGVTASAAPMAVNGVRPNAAGELDCNGHSKIQKAV